LDIIVIGADTHKDSHTFAAVGGGTGAVIADRTVAARAAGFGDALRWARSLEGERVWAIEDCRHVSGRLERFLIARGERIVRVPPKRMAGARDGGRERGKSDRIDAIAVARAALKDGLEALPAAHLDDRALAIRLLVDHRERLVGTRTRLQNDVRWHLHDLWPELKIPTGGLDRDKWLDKLAARLARAHQSARVRVARDEIRRIRELTRAIRELGRELAPLVAEYAPQLLAEHGCGPLTAAKLIGETAGIERFATDAKYARSAGSAPIPASSGRRDRHRLDRGGNRQLNCALHRLAVNKGRLDPDTAAYLDRKQAEGKTRMEALRCLKRHLARRVYRLLRADAPNPTKDTNTHMITTHNTNASTPEPVLALT
jgi:transposase